MSVVRAHEGSIEAITGAGSVTRINSIGIQFGNQEGHHETNGMISVNHYVPGTMSIVGAGTLNNNRKIDMFGHIKMDSTLEVLGDTIFRGNLNCSATLNAIDVGSNLRSKIDDLINARFDTKSVQPEINNQTVLNVARQYFHDRADWVIEYPKAYTKINARGIQLGNQGTDWERNSGQISSSHHEPDCLCIVGISRTQGSERKVKLWAEKNFIVNGPVRAWSFTSYSDQTIKDEIETVDPKACTNIVTDVDSKIYFRNDDDAFEKK